MINNDNHFLIFVKRRICEGRRTTVECVIDHDKRSNNWNQGHCRTEEGTPSNCYEGRPKSCPAVRDLAKRCRCIVQGRRACISPAPSLSPEERFVRLIPARPNTHQFTCWKRPEIPRRKPPDDSRQSWSSVKHNRQITTHCRSGFHCVPRSYKYVNCLINLRVDLIGIGRGQIFVRDWLHLLWSYIFLDSVVFFCDFADGCSILGFRGGSVRQPPY